MKMSGYASGKMCPDTPLFSNEKPVYAEFLQETLVYALVFAVNYGQIWVSLPCICLYLGKFAKKKS